VAVERLLLEEVVIESVVLVEANDGLLVAGDSRPKLSKVKHTRTQEGVATAK
jgi:hypothetical protein